MIQIIKKKKPGIEVNHDLKIQDKKMIFVFCRISKGMENLTNQIWQKFKMDKVRGGDEKKLRNLEISNNIILIEKEKEIDLELERFIINSNYF